MKNSHLIFVLLSIALLCSNCKTDKRQVSKKELIGRWDMVSATRNGDVTNTLDKSFFNVTPDIFSHNLNGDSTGISYQFNDNEIVMEDELLENLQIVEIINDTLYAKTKIGTYRFEFTMLKNEVE